MATPEDAGGVEGGEEEGLLPVNTRLDYSYLLFHERRATATCKNHFNSGYDEAVVLASNGAGIRNCRSSSIASGGTTA